MQLFAQNDRESCNVQEWLARIPVFKPLCPAVLERVASSTHARRLKKGELLFRDGDAPRFLFAIVIGQIKEAVRSPQGEEKIIEILGPNQTFGEASMSLDQPYPFFAECLRDTLVLCIAKDAVFELIDTDPEFASRILASLSMRIHSLVMDIESYTRQTAEQRLIGYLMRHGRPGSRGTDLKVSLPTTKLTVASRLGMSPATLSRILQAFAEAGLIHVRGRQLSIADPRRLSELAV